MLLLRTNLVHYTPLSTHYIKKYIKQHHIDSNIILSENSHPLFSRTASRDCRQCSARRYFYSKWVVVHAFSLNVLQVISHFFSYHIQRRWRKSSPSARRRVSHLTNTFFFFTAVESFTIKWAERKRPVKIVRQNTFHILLHVQIYCAVPGGRAI